MDEIEHRIRAARPASGHRDLPITDRAKRELADLVLYERAPRRRPSRRRRLLRTMAAAGLATVAVVASSIAVASFWSPTSVHAATPPLLSVAPLSGTTESLLSALSGTIDEDAIGETNMLIEVDAWTLATDDDGIATSNTIAPEHYSITRGADGTYATRVTTGQAVDAYGAPVENAIEPGALVWEEAWGPGEYAFLFPGPLPTNASEIGGFLSQAIGASEPITAAKAIQATNDLLFEQQLTPLQWTALIQYFATLPDLVPVGEARDRLGRTGMVFSARDAERAGYQRNLVVSPETGRILATETLYSGDDRTDIASPSVVNYFVWN